MEQPAQLQPRPDASQANQPQPARLGKNDPEELLTAKEVAEMIKVTRHTVYQLCKEGRLPSKKVGGMFYLRIRRGDVDDFMKPHPGKQKKEGTSST